VTLEWKPVGRPVGPYAVYPQREDPSWFGGGWNGSNPKDFDLEFGVE
jgi:hypothetical protein